MSYEKKIICILCPLGCIILVRKKGDNCDVIEGNKCKKGIAYAKNELLNPTRMLTTSVIVEDGEWPLVSVKTSTPIKKEKLLQVLSEIKKVKTKAPVKCGQVILKNVLHTSADIIATKNVKKRRTNIK